MNPLKDHQTQQCDAAPDLILAEMNPWARYKQAMAELDKRRRGYQEILDDNELLELDIEEKQEELKEAEDKRRATIELKKLQRRRLEGQKVANDIAREGSRFLAEVLSLQGTFGELTPERRRALDLEAWEHEFLCEIATAMILKIPLNPNSVKNLSRIRGVEGALKPIGDDPVGWLKNNTGSIPEKLEFFDTKHFLALINDSHDQPTNINRIKS